LTEHSQFYQIVQDEAGRSVKIVRAGKQYFVKLLADAGENRCYGGRNAHGNQAVLDRSRPRFVTNKTSDGTHATVSDSHNRKERPISWQLSLSVNGVFTSAKIPTQPHFPQFVLVHLHGCRNHS
jgi:hypothetical protein